MDRALWITWYDLPAAGRDAHLKWLHNSYMPNMVERPGFLHAAHFASEQALPQAGVPAGQPGRLRHTDDKSVPTGNAYILVFGAEDAHAFARPVPAKFHAGLSKDDQRMLAMRERARVNIFTEEARADGPEGKRREKGMALSPCIQLGSFDAGSLEEDELLDWYANWRLPCMNKLAGCVGIRKLVSVSGWAKHGVLYEFVSLAERNRHFPNHEKVNPEMDAWTDRLVRKLVHAPGSPNVAQRIASAVKKRR